MRRSLHRSVTGARAPGRSRPRRCRLPPPLRPRGLPARPSTTVRPSRVTTAVEGTSQSSPCAIGAPGIGPKVTFALNSGRTRSSRSRNRIRVSTVPLARSAIGRPVTPPWYRCPGRSRVNLHRLPGAHPMNHRLRHLGIHRYRQGIDQVHHGSAGPTVAVNGETTSPISANFFTMTPLESARECSYSPAAPWRFAVLVCRSHRRFGRLDRRSRGGEVSQRPCRIRTW